MPKRKAEWQNNYITRTYDRVNLTIPKGKKEEFQAHAQEMGESLNAFINRAMQEAIERDNVEQPLQSDGHNSIPEVTDALGVTDDGTDGV